MNFLNATDTKLISLLRANARISVVELSKILRVSRTTVQNRMKRLENNGTILKYTIEMSPDIEANAVRAFMSIVVQGKLAPNVINELQGYPQITSLYNTNGHWDIVAEIRTDTLESFNKLLGDVRLIDGVSSTETNLLLNTIVF